MALTMGRIIKGLPNCNIQAVYGDPDQPIFAAGRYSATEHDPNTVYFTTKELLPPKGSQLHIIVVSKARITEIFRRATQILVDDYRRNVELTKLRQLVLQDADDDLIATTCRTIMQNPVWIMDSTLNPVSFSISEDKLPSNGYIPLKFYIGRLSDSAEILQPDSTCPANRIVSVISNENGHTIGYLVVLDIDRPFVSSVDLNFTEYVCSILSQWKRIQRPVSLQNANAEFIDDLLQLRITDPLVIHQQVKALKWTVSEKYYILVIERTPSEQLSSAHIELRDVLHRELYTFGRYYLCILSCPLKQHFAHDDFSMFVSVLKKHELRAALSNGFTDIANLVNAFNQAIECLKLRSWRSHSLQIFSRYEDCLLTHLIKIAEQQGVNLLSICDPILVSLLLKDREKGTENFKTIAAYIFSGLNLKETSAVLYIHRNTAYRRLVYLEEQYQLDFSNPRELERMKISVVILGYLGMVNLDTFLPERDPFDS